MSNVVKTPLMTLKEEADGMRTAIQNVDEGITNLMLQKSGLQVMLTAFENEMDRIRANQTPDFPDFEVEG